MSQRHWSPSPQQSGPQQFSRPKLRRGAAIAIIAAAILIATALIITVILTTRTTPPPSPTSPAPLTPTPLNPATSTTPKATPSQKFQRIDETNAPPNVNGWTIGNSLGTPLLPYTPPGTGKNSPKFVNVSNFSGGTVRADWKQYLVNPTEEVNGQATCGIDISDPDTKACYLDTTSPFGLIEVSTTHEDMTMDTVISFTTDLATELN